MNKILYTYNFILVAVLLSLSSCYSHKNIGFLQETNKTNGIPQYEKETSLQPYKLMVNDQITYRLITMDETISKSMASQNQRNEEHTYSIAKDGTIELPFIGEIQIVGNTISEAEKIIEDSFKTIIPDASVKLALFNKTFTVIGDVGTGQFPLYKEKMNIYQALALSGDLHNSGDRKHVKIVRQHPDNKIEILEFDIRAKTLIDSKYYFIYPNDIIYVSRSKSSFFKVASYTGVLGLITSSISLLSTAIIFTYNASSK